MAASDAATEIKKGKCCWVKSIGRPGIGKVKVRAKASFLVHIVQIILKRLPFGILGFLLAQPVAFGQG
jgi:hypothetical protein